MVEPIPIEIHNFDLNQIKDKYEDHHNVTYTPGSYRKVSGQLNSVIYYRPFYRQP